MNAESSSSAATPVQATNGFGRRLSSLRDRFESAPLSSRTVTLALAALIAFYLVITAAQTSRRLWHDELYTYYIAKSATLGQLWRNISLDLQPPLVFLTERVSLRVFGDNRYTARIPEIISFLIGSLCLYRFVGRRLRPAYGILAMVVFWATPIEYYATEARPYGLVIACFGIAMLAWQTNVERAAAGQTGGSSALVLVLAVTGMMCSHVLGVIYIVPFCVAELFLFVDQRRFRWPVWAGLVLPAAIPFIFLRLISRYRASSFPGTTQASPNKVFGFFFRMLEPESLFLLLALSIALLAGLALRGSRDSRSSAATRFGRLTFSRYEWIFAWSLLLIPILVTFAMMRSHGIAYPRYSAPTVLLFGLLFSVLVFACTNASRSAAVAASCLLLLYIAGSNEEPFRNAIGNLRPLHAPPAAEPIVSVYPELPVVAASGLNFLELDNWADPAFVSRLYYLTGRKYAIEYAHATIFEGMASIKAQFPIRATVAPYDRFVVEHPRFLAMGDINYPEDWLLRRLIDIHASLQYVGVFFGRPCYLVTMPGHAVSEMAGAAKPPSS